MPGPDVFMKTGDLLPELEVILEDANGDPVNLSTATGVTFSMRATGSSTALISNSTATIVDAVAGRVKYTWASGNTGTAGDYDGEFTATFTGKQETFPNNRMLWLQFKGQIA